MSHLCQFADGQTVCKYVGTKDSVRPRVCQNAETENGSRILDLQQLMEPLQTYNDIQKVETIFR